MDVEQLRADAVKAFADRYQLGPVNIDVTRNVEEVEGCVERPYPPYPDQDEEAIRHELVAALVASLNKEAWQLDARMVGIVDSTIDQKDATRGIYRIRLRLLMDPDASPTHPRP